MNYGYSYFYQDTIKESSKIHSNVQTAAHSMAVHSTIAVHQSQTRRAVAIAGKQTDRQICTHEQEN